MMGTVDRLIERNNNTGRTLLHMAISGMTNILLAINVNDGDFDHRTPLGSLR